MRSIAQYAAMRMERVRGHAVFLFLLTAGILIYIQSFRLYFFQDDFVWISHVKDLAADWTLLFHPRISGFFMPVIYGYFALLYQVFGFTPAPYYAANIILHALNAFLLFLLLCRLGQKKGVALMSAVFFLSFRYPMEAVVWVSAATELISAAWLLGIGLAWVAYLQTERAASSIAALGLTLGFLATKEWSALTLPFLLMLTTWHLSRSDARIRARNARRALVQLAPFLALFAVYFSVQFFLQQDQSPLIAKGYYRIGWHAAPNIIDNTLLSFVPTTDIAHDHPSLWLIASSLALFVGAAFSVYRWRRAGDIVPGLSLVWIVVAYVPTSFFTWDPLVSRYGYLPAIGAAIFIASVVYQLVQTGRRMIQYTAATGAAVYIGLNIVYISQMITSYYLPMHAESRRFSRAVEVHRGTLQTAETIGIYANTPHRDFILPEVLHAGFDIPKDRVRVLPVGAPCAGIQACLWWDGEEKEVRMVR